jgi:hypothetical protein
MVKMTSSVGGQAAGQAAEAFPVAVLVERPASFSRLHVLARLGIALLLSLLLIFLWLVALIYVAVPVVAAVMISGDGPEKFARETSRNLKNWLHWLVAFDAYMTFLTDRFPFENPAETVRYEVQTATPRGAGEALLRLAASLPNALALAVVGLIGATLTSIVAGLFVLVAGNYPDALYRFHLGVVTWGGRLLAYHASLTGRYPPFLPEAAAAPGSGAAP